MNQIRWTSNESPMHHLNKLSNVFYCFLLLAGLGCDSDHTNETRIDSGTLGEATAPSEASPETDADQRISDPAPALDESTADAPYPQSERDNALQRSEELISRGEYGSAETILKSLLVTNPDDVESTFRLAMLAAQQGNLFIAVNYLEAIPNDHPEAGLPALGQAADWYFQLERYQEAEERYKEILNLIPDAAEAHRKLAYLYNRQGRRHEAAFHVRSLCSQGNVLQDELHSLIHLSDAMYDERSRAPQNQDRPYWPIDSGAEARKAFSELDYATAVKVLQKAVQDGTALPSMVALFGRAAAEAQDSKAMQSWLRRSDDLSTEYADHWAAMGLVLLQQNQVPEAGRCFLEALIRDPTDFRSMSRLRSIVESSGLTDQAQQIEERFGLLKEITKSNNEIVDSPTPNPNAMIQISRQLDAVDRKLESALWKLLAGFHQELPASSMQQLQSELTAIIDSGRSFPDHTTGFLGVKRDAFPLPDLSPNKLQQSIAGTLPVRKPTDVVTQPQFINVAESTGIQHAFQVATNEQNRGFAVYQSVGGAVAVVDYDLDGRQDLYFAQGAADPPDFRSSQGNELYRTVDSGLINVSEVSDCNEQRYSLGVTAGDWNQDGFADLVIANIGENLLLLNNGDGTFRAETIDDRDDKSLMSTSLAIADLNGDHLPDLFEVNYLHDENLPRRPRRNLQGDVIETMMPKDFQSAMDRIIIQGADGSMTSQPVSDSLKDARSGLGVVIGDFDHQPGNEIFVGNDVDANQFWKQSATSQDWNDTAMLRGCAYGFSGAKTASMGIAAGDLDRNGWMDLHITNFQGESVSHYLNQDGFFRDLNIQYQLAEPSQDVLGFGAQAFDFDNDGDLDLMVANGHIENSVATPDPFAQPAQLFRNRGDQFELTKVLDTSNYWSTSHVGRGVAKLDWNEDGNLDLVVTHLNEKSALLVNQTSNANHWLRIKIIGTKSERDGIGSRIDLHLGDQIFTEWVTAGDGFFSHNESVLHFGLGTLTRFDKIIVRWPSGKIQSVAGSDEVNRTVTIIENQTEAFDQ